MRQILAIVGAVFLLGSCGGDGSTARPTTEPGPVEPSSCPSELPFRPGYLPPGVKRDLKSGPGGGVASNPQVIEFHYEASNGVFIDIRRGAAFFPVDNPTPVDVLGETAEFGEIEHGIGFNFLTEGGSCGRYEVSAYGLESDEVRLFAEGLRTR